MAATPETTTATKKPFITRKRVLTAAFAIAVGALAIDDLKLRVENFVLGAVVETLIEENEALRQNQENDSGNGPFIIIPQEKDRIYEISAPAREITIPAHKAAPTARLTSI